MILLVFAASILVSVLLERQARQQQSERTLECERLGIQVPPHRPKLKRTEAGLNIGLGLLLVLLAVGTATMVIFDLHMAEQFPEHAAAIKGIMSVVIQQGAFLLASGIALMWLGWKAIREISIFESNETGRR